MINDVIRLAMEQAVAAFGDKGDGVFNGAGFGEAFMRIAGVKGSLDGKIVRAMLAGRPDAQVLPGGAHYRLIEKRPRVGK